MLNLQWRNSTQRYGVVSKSLHWLVAVTVIGLFALGLWMVGLDYYHGWYKRGPDLHRSIGVLLMITMVLRLLWLLATGKPAPLPTHHAWERALARLGHVGLYALVFSLGVSGYLISTADGRAVEVFTWFTVPSSGEWVDNQEDIAGEIHEWLAYGLISLVVIHALAAIKHHFLDRDDTLKRML